MSFLSFQRQLSYPFLLLSEGVCLLDFEKNAISYVSIHPKPCLLKKNPESRIRGGKFGVDFEYNLC